MRNRERTFCAVRIECRFYIVISSWVLSATFCSSRPSYRVVFAGGKGGNFPVHGFGLPPLWFKILFPTQGKKFPVHGPKPQPGKRGREVYYYKNILTLFGDWWVRFGEHYRKSRILLLQSYCICLLMQLSAKKSTIRVQKWKLHCFKLNILFF